MKDDNKIRVLKIEPGKMPYEKEMVNDLEGIQAEVGGSLNVFISRMAASLWSMRKEN